MLCFAIAELVQLKAEFTEKNGYEQQLVETKYKYEFKCHVSVEEVFRWNWHPQSEVTPDFEVECNIHLDTWLKRNRGEKMAFIERIVDEPDWLEHEESSCNSDL